MRRDRQGKRARNECKGCVTTLAAAAATGGYLIHNAFDPFR
jgi:hypothetical protein